MMDFASFEKKRHKVALLMLTTMVAGAQILNVLLNLDTQADMPTW